RIREVITLIKIYKKNMSDNSHLRFSEAMAYVTCIIVSTAMIWLLLISIFEPCDPCPPVKNTPLTPLPQNANSGPPFVVTVLHPPLRKGGIAGPLN
ncbi:MAG: hypothetical protein MUO95_06600, partial [Methanoregula sp.]|nr:hypothetical protein [Methanoregula sp.]